MSFTETTTPFVQAIETCRCGAKLEIQVKDAVDLKRALDEFRATHMVCRAKRKQHDKKETT